MELRESITVSHLPEGGSCEIHLGRSVAIARGIDMNSSTFCAIEAGDDLFYRGEWNHTPAASLFIVHPGELHANRAYDENGCTYRILIPIQIGSTEIWRNYRGERHSFLSSACIVRPRSNQSISKTDARA